MGRSFYQPPLLHGPCPASLPRLEREDRAPCLCGASQDRNGLAEFRSRPQRDRSRKRSSHNLAVYFVSPRNGRLSPLLLVLWACLSEEGGWGTAPS